jgi:hypothetical protein
MNINVKHLSLTFGGGIGDGVKNKKVAEKFVLAEDDRELAEVVGLLAASCHFTSFSGVVRGRGASIAVLESEHQSMQLRWDTKLLQLTADTFERRGRVWFLTKKSEMFSKVPIVREGAAWWSQHKVVEHLVVNPEGLVQFRALAFRWGLGAES